MPRLCSPRAIVLALIGLSACRDAIDPRRTTGQRGVVELGEASPVVTVATVADAIPPATRTAAAATPSSTTTTPDELELSDVEVEWVDRSRSSRGAWFDKPQLLRVHATAKLRAELGRDSEITVKAVCAADPVPLADAEIASIQRRVLRPPPAGGGEFPLRVDLFPTMPPRNPSLCRVQFLVIDDDATTPRRVVLELCWRPERPVALALCTEEDELPIDAAATDGWGIDRVEFDARGELLFSVVAGRTRAPDRIALRTTCHTKEKTYVDFDLLLGRWHALAPGEVMRRRIERKDLDDMLRRPGVVECDLGFQEARLDDGGIELRGTKDIEHVCVGPTGLTPTACRVEESEATTWDRSSAPAKFESWYASAYALDARLQRMSITGDLTVLATMAKGARIEVLARCGRREAKEIVKTPIGLDLVWPGESLHLSTHAQLVAKSARNCALEVTLHAIDHAGKPASWSLVRTCFDRYGTGGPCPT